MTYSDKLRNRMSSIQDEWWVGLLLILFSVPVTAFVGVIASGGPNVGVIILGTRFDTLFAGTIDVDITVSLGTILLTLVVVGFARFVTNWTWQKDADLLKSELLSDSIRIETLLGLDSIEDVEKLECTLSLTFWELIFLRNYVKWMETTIRQSTRAPAHLLETPLRSSGETILANLALIPPLTQVECEVFIHEVDSCMKIPFHKRAWYRIKTTHPFKSFFKANIDVLHLLTKGITKEDYENKNMQQFGNLLIDLTKATDERPRIFSQESVKSLIRLAVKDYDLQILRETSTEVTMSKVWEITWDETSAFIESQKSGKIPIVESGQLKGFKVSLNKTRGDGRRESGSHLIISGYTTPDKEKKLAPKILKLQEDLYSKTYLLRDHRLLLKDLFDGELEGNSLQLQDSSNIAMILEAFISRQYTLSELEKAALSRDHDKLSNLLLRVNRLPQYIEDRFAIERLNNGNTLSTAGLIGLSRLGESTREFLQTSFDIHTNTSEHERWQERSALLDIPQITDDKTLQSTMKTEEFAKSGTFGWVATGGGAWIISENLPRKFVKEGGPVKGWLIFFHHPLREKVFLEILTHQNYHYAWEILHNRVQFQRRYSQDKSTDLHVQWSREAFQPSGNFIVVNTQSREILTDATPIFHKKPQADTCIMMTRSNQLIRNPVNALNLIFAENSSALTPIPAAGVDFFLRQRVHEAIALAFTQDEALVENGKPTDLSQSANWLRPLRLGESINTSITFNDHKFSDPRSWNQLGFLDIIVRETKCAYGIIKLLSSYIHLLDNDKALPLKEASCVPQATIETDIQHLRHTYDMVCDFLGGQGDFALCDVTAVASCKGYLEWLEYVLSKLENVGKSYNAAKIFINAREGCLKWLTKLRNLFEDLDDPLHSRVTDCIETGLN